MTRADLRRKPGNGRRALLALLVAGAAAQAAVADERGEARAEAEAKPAESAAPSAAERTNEGAEAGEAFQPIVYVPPNRGRARDTAAGGTRNLSAAGRRVRVAVLAPKDHVALTTRSQPTLYWYVSAATDLRIDVTVVQEDAIDPLLEMTVPGPVERGIHAVDLEALGVRLDADKTYRWHVAVVHDADRRSADTLAEGLIERTAPPGDLERSLRASRRRFAPYALSGIWYDAMAELRAAIAAEPGNRRLVLQEVALLEQAELGEIASFARRSVR